MTQWIDIYDEEHNRFEIVNNIQYIHITCMNGFVNIYIYIYIYISHTQFDEK